MSRREDIDNAIWSDPEFEALSPHAKLVYFWTFTNQRCGMAGLYKFAPNQAALEIGLTDDELATALAELVAATFVLLDEQVLWVRTRVRHLRSRTPQIAKSIAKDVEKLRPDHPLRTRFLSMYASQPWLRAALAELAETAVLAPQAVSGEPLAGTSIGGSNGTSSRRFQGNGTGKGKGTGGKGSGENHDDPTEPGDPAVAPRPPSPPVLTGDFKTDNDLRREHDGAVEQHRRVFDAWVAANFQGIATGYVEHAIWKLDRANAAPTVEAVRWMLNDDGIAA